MLMMYIKAVLLTLCIISTSSVAADVSSIDLLIQMNEEVKSNTKTLIELTSSLK